MKVRPRTLVRLVMGFVVLLLAFTLYRANAAATVDYARQTGQPCAACHVRPEGGGELSAQGIAYAQGGYQWPVPAGVEPYTPSNALRLLRLIVGYLHLTVTVLWFGTIFYIHVIVRPQQLTTGIPRLQGIIGWASIGIMAATGITLTLYRRLETGVVFAGTFGTVFVIKLALFGTMVLLAAIATFWLTPRLKRALRGQVTLGSASQDITRETLPSHDGREGRRAVVAVHDKLYEVTESRLWRNGLHIKQHQAGQDLTAALEGAPHGTEVLEKVPMIGSLPDAAGSRRPRAGRAQRAFIGFAYANLVLLFGVLGCVAWWKWGFGWAEARATPGGAPVSMVSDASADCIACHRENEFMRSQIVEWERSAHAGAQVGCYECHAAEAGDPDAMDHNGYTVSVLVTPNDCGGCHVRETEQFAASRHSRGGDILDSLDNILGERVEGVAAAVLGCQQCHGAPVEVRADGTLSPASWPNTGIGRINPDGSQGACSTCHTRHLFSVAVAREPDACGNCHLGPDHPQKEIYEESKHGIAFAANRAQMNLDARPWVLGEDYAAAPTCATCHMSAVPGLESNHDVGLRIAWTLRPVVSNRLENWDARRAEMATVCRQCHAPGFYTNFFQQYDDAVELYNGKFALPATQIMERLREAGLLTDRDFDEPIEWTFFYLWHHEGRRARHGAAMMGPDYVQWHGFYEVADRFYNAFLPEAEALLPGVTEPFLAGEHHRWREE